MKLNAFMLLFIIAAMLLVSAAFATPPSDQSADQHISGIVQPYTITITAPGDISQWELQ